MMAGLTVSEYTALELYNKVDIDIDFIFFLTLEVDLSDIPNLVPQII